MSIISWIFSLFSKQKIIEEVKPVSKFITEKDFNELASKFGIETAALKAIFKIEAGGKSGF